MSPYSQRQRRGLATIGLTLGCVLAVIAYFHQSPQAAAQPADADAVVFSMEVDDSGGGVLAHPVVMGEPGQKVKVRLMCEEDPQQERMHLTLDPMGLEDGQMLYSYELSVAGHVDTQRGTVKLAMGRERRIRIQPRNSDGVTLSLYAESLPHYLKRHKTHVVTRVAS